MNGVAADEVHVDSIVEFDEDHELCAITGLRPKPMRDSSSPAINGSFLDLISLLPQGKAKKINGRSNLMIIGGGHRLH